MRPPEAIILDVLLPDGRGTEVCREVRTWSEVPILVLSAVGEEQEKIAALDDGALYGALAAAAMQLADGLGDARRLKDLSERFWGRCQSVAGSDKRTVLTGFVRAAGRTAFHRRRAVAR